MKKIKKSAKPDRLKLEVRKCAVDPLNDKVKKINIFCDMLEIIQKKSELLNFCFLTYFEASLFVLIYKPIFLNFLSITTSMFFI